MRIEVRRTATDATAVSEAPEENAGSILVFGTAFPQALFCSGKEVESWL